MGHVASWLGTLGQSDSCVVGLDLNAPSQMKSCNEEKCLVGKPENVGESWKDSDDQMIGSLRSRQTRMAE